MLSLRRSGCGSMDQSSQIRDGSTTCLCFKQGLDRCWPTGFGVFVLSYKCLLSRITAPSCCLVVDFWWILHHLTLTLTLLDFTFHISYESWVKGKPIEFYRLNKLVSCIEPRTCRVNRNNILDFLNGSKRFFLTQPINYDHWYKLLIDIKNTFTCK